MYLTVFSQQPVYDTCLTTKQINFVITQAFTLKENQTSLLLCNDKVEVLSKGTGELNKIISSKNQEINLHILKFNDCHSDNVALSKELHSSEIKIKLQKFTIYFIGSIAIVELGYIGLKSLVNK